MTTENQPSEEFIAFYCEKVMKNYSDFSETTKFVAKKLDLPQIKVIDAWASVCDRLTNLLSD